MIAAPASCSPAIISIQDASTSPIFNSYLASTRRLVAFTEGKPVTHVLGNHIEQLSTTYVDYPVGTRYQPEEHEFALGRAHLLELLDGLEKLNGQPRRVLIRDFTIDPKP